MDGKHLQVLIEKFQIEKFSRSHTVTGTVQHGRLPDDWR